MINSKVEMIGNYAGVIGIAFLMLLTLGFQLSYHELPCPLCLLQRLGFFMMGLGFLMNLRFGFHSSHYAVVLLSGFLTSFAAMRQIILHIIPGTGEYGSPVFGLHLYTWSYLIAVFTMVMTAILLTMHRDQTLTVNDSPRYPRLTNSLFAILSLLLLINVISAFLECGFAVCEEDPVRYAMLG